MRWFWFFVTIIVLGCVLGCSDASTDEKASWALRMTCAWIPQVNEDAFVESRNPSSIVPFSGRRWQWVNLPVEPSGKWRVRSATPSMETPDDRKAGALLPTKTSQTLEVLPAHRLTLDEIDVRVKQIPVSARVAAVVMDDDELARLAPLGDRVVSLVVRGNLRDLFALSVFPNLEALSLYTTQTTRLRPVKLNKLRHLELTFNTPLLLAPLLHALKLSSIELQELVLSGEIHNSELTALSRFPFLEVLVLDFLIPDQNIRLDFAGPLCHLRELDIRAGNGLFEVLWSWVAFHPRLEVLSARSLTHEPLHIYDIPSSLRVLRLAGQMNEEDIIALSRVASLRHLELTTPDTSPVNNATSRLYFPFSNRLDLPSGTLHLETLRHLRLESLTLQGNFRLPSQFSSVRHLRFVAGPNVQVLDLSRWTSLENLELILQNAWALRLPTANQLRTLSLQDLSDPPVQIPANWITASLAKQVDQLRLEVPGLIGEISIPGTVRQAFLAGSAASSITLSQLSRWKPEILEIRSSPASRVDWATFFRAFPTTLRHVRLLDIHVAAGQDWVWDGPPYPGPPDFCR